MNHSNNSSNSFQSHMKQRPQRLLYDADSSHDADRLVQGIMFRRLPQTAVDIAPSAARARAISAQHFRSMVSESRTGGAEGRSATSLVSRLTPVLGSDGLRPMSPAGGGETSVSRKDTSQLVDRARQRHGVMQRLLGDASESLQMALAEGDTTADAPETAEAFAEGRASRATGPRARRLQMAGLHVKPHGTSESLYQDAVRSASVIAGHTRLPRTGAMLVDAEGRPASALHPVTAKLRSGLLHEDGESPTPDTTLPARLLDAAFAPFSSTSAVPNPRTSTDKSRFALQVSKMNTDARRLRQGVLGHVLALVNDDPAAKAEFVARSEQAVVARKGRSFSANVIYLSPALASRLMPRDESPNSSPDVSPRRDETNFMARNAARAKLYGHIVAAERDERARTEDERQLNAWHSREAHHQNFLAFLEHEATTVRGVERSPARHWPGILIATLVAQSFARILDGARSARARQDAPPPPPVRPTEVELDDAAAARTLMLVSSLRLRPKFISAIAKYRENRLQAATTIVHSFLVTLARNSKIQLRCRQLLMQIRKVQRSIRAFLSRRREAEALLSRYIDRFVDERVAFTRQAILDYEKEDRRRRAALGKNPSTATLHADGANAILRSSTGEGSSVQDAILQARSRQRGVSPTQKKGHRNSISDDVALRGRRSRGHAGLPKVVVEEATRVLSNLLVTRPVAEGIAVDDSREASARERRPMTAAERIRAALATATSPRPLHPKHVPSPEAMAALREHAAAHLRIPPELLFSASCLPLSVVRFWPDPPSAVLFARDMHDMPHADRLVSRLSLKYRARLTDFFFRRERLLHKAAVVAWRKAYQEARSRFDWERELAAHGMPSDASAGYGTLRIPDFPRRAALPTPNEARMMAHTGYQILFIEKRLMAEAQASVAQRVRLQSPEGRVVLEHEKALVAQKVLTEDHILAAFHTVVRRVGGRVSNVRPSFLNIEGQ